jgi:hypothetical protein
MAYPAAAAKSRIKRTYKRCFRCHLFIAIWCFFVSATSVSSETPITLAVLFEA